MDASRAHCALASLVGLEPDRQLHRLQADGLPPLFIEQWWGHEHLASGFDYWVDVLHPDASLPMEEWLGSRGSLVTRLDDGRDHHRRGHVAEASLLGSDGGLARYRLHYVPWTWFLGHARHSRVYQERRVRDIVDDVLGAHGELARWRWSDDAVAALAAAPVRSYCVQYREPDLAFILRLLAEEGIACAFDGQCGDELTLVMFFDSTVQPENTQSARDGGVRFHRNDGTETADTLQQLGPYRRLGSNRLSLSTSDYHGPVVRHVQLPLQGADGSPREIYDPAGAHAFARARDGQCRARRAAEAHEASLAGWVGAGSVRSLQAGRFIRVLGTGMPSAPVILPIEVLHHGCNPSPLATVSVPPRAEPPSAWLEASRSLPGAPLDAAAATGCVNRFRAVDQQKPWRPVLPDGTGERINPRPLAPGYQTATVIGGGGRDDADLHADSQGRIRVRLHLQGTADADATCWMRVAQRYAGPGVGAQFLPRIGQEVLVGFLEGDIDRPLVLGALYNGRGEAGVTSSPAGTTVAATDPDLFGRATDAGPSAQGNATGGHAPAWHAMAPGDGQHRHAGALWGIQSSEWSGTGYNRLLFDDSDAQLRLQLASSQASSELNLGHLLHQADNHRGSLRGEGLELRTDAWGTLRAERGVWLTARPHGASSPAGEVVGASALLQQAATLAETSHATGITHGTVGLAAHAPPEDSAGLAGLQRVARASVSGQTYAQACAEGARRSAAGEVPHTDSPTLGLCGHAGVAMVAGQALHWHSAQHVALGSGQNSDVSVAGQARLHARQAVGMLAAGSPTAVGDAALSVVAGQAELDIQAQSAAINLQSRAPLRTVSAHASVQLAAARTLHIATAGGASITLEGGNLVVNCPGTLTVHAGQTFFEGPAQLTQPLPDMPTSVLSEHVPKLAFRLQDIPGPHGMPLAGQAWKIVRTRQALDAELRDGALVPESWAETLAEGEADAQGDVSLDDALCERIWNDAGRFPGRLFLVHGIDVIPLQRPRSYSSSPGVRVTLDTLEAINYGKTLADLPDDAALYAYRQRAEYEFQSHIDADPAQRKEI
ncbi:type VI secretion system tip protein VgrG [Stenotrophomonas sp. ESTM1D_MKCIP4_1]|uniref:type VI secretion system Vgr family protein n=1 Tax=Stenotrophomonas sp. ESTM1D_MKCIP4_1 TaxID=2072414 RepID=UPI000D53F32A|nr:type VI secretion system Vgr family protein [Stenotrophomonas sp. ESTM1D_MKCIP4_1]AWH52941.1 type VI secretion system tip protein VgrG [Stenotrophomonas sp. ESTM1D_MKCIP4_1]